MFGSGLIFGDVSFLDQQCVLKHNLGSMFSYIKKYFVDCKETLTVYSSELFTARHLIL